METRTVLPQILQHSDERLKSEITLLLEALYQCCGYDFRNYTYASIKRRLVHRMHMDGIQSVSIMQDRVFHESGYGERLANDLTIHVTEMFRDPTFFHAFRSIVVPQLRRFPHLRIWHAGCSTGEEVYSMAILLHEEGLLESSRIYATDINEPVLEIAKTGRFPLEPMQVYTRNYQKAGGQAAFSEYYQVESSHAEFKSNLRNRIVFSQHNLVTDGSFNEFHVIICRNVLIYFNNQLQSHVHKLFYESLADSGYLVLGSKETVSHTMFSASYDEISANERIYQKSQRGGRHR